MSAVQGQQETRIIEFNAPNALNVDVIGVDEKTRESFLNFQQPSQLIRGIQIIATASEVDQQFEFDVLVNGYVQRTLYSDQLKANLQGPIWPGFPLNFGPGQKQLQMRQVTKSGSSTYSKVRLMLIFSNAI